MGNSTCAVGACDRPAITKGYCNAHYQRVRLYGDPQAGKPLRPLKGKRLDELTCSVEGCGTRAAHRRMCGPHYGRWKKYGDPLAGRTVKGTFSSGPCVVDGCGDLANGGLGWCKRHYQRWYLAGDPLTPDKYARRGAPLRERLEFHIAKTDHCWFWTGTVGSDGYGRTRIRLPDGRMCHAAHRAVYEVFVGPIPEGLELDHLCRNRACVRPEHLDPVTREENIRRIPPPEPATHCGNGHEFTEENTRWVRVCVTCSRDSTARYRSRKSA